MLEALGLRLPMSFETPLLSSQRNSAALCHPHSQTAVKAGSLIPPHEYGHRAEGCVEGGAEICRGNTYSAFNTCKAKTSTLLRQLPNACNDFVFYIYIYLVRCYDNCYHFQVIFFPSSHMSLFYLHQTISPMQRFHSKGKFLPCSSNKGLSVNVQQNPASFRLLKRLDKETNGKWRKWRVVKGNPLHQSAKQSHELLVEISPWALKCPRERNPSPGVD